MRSLFVRTGTLCERGKVSVTELEHAVNEILSAVGINMVEEKRTLQRTINWQENLRESQAALLLVQVGVFFNF
jgi:sacsin